MKLEQLGMYALVFCAGAAVGASLVRRRFRAPVLLSHATPAAWQAEVTAIIRRLEGILQTVQSDIVKVAGRVEVLEAMKSDHREPAQVLDPLQETPKPTETPLREMLRGRQKHLSEILESSEFRNMVWPQLMHDYDAARQTLAVFFEANGLKNVRFEAQPPLRDGNANRWEYILAAGDGDDRAYLVPRPFGRFDVAFHAHLFVPSGTVRGADTYYRQLIRCAVLRRTEGPVTVGSSIDDSLVVQPGEVSVEAPL